MKVPGPKDAPHARQGASKDALGSSGIKRPVPPPSDSFGASSSRSGQTDPLIGEVIGDRFRILSRIARGGMGVVYRAEQAPLGRVVALKVLSMRNAEMDPEFRKRFFLEAATAAKLSHPNTVTIFDYGQSEDLLFIAMELVNGRTLKRALSQEGPFPAERAIPITLQMCRSLREAHQMGVIHRDMKPGNVMLVERDDEDHVKLLDFGLVKQLAPAEEGEELTRAGVMMGSPKYMSPEQVSGEDLDGRSDIYSVGVMLYEMVTGRTPFERDNPMQILMDHVRTEVPPMVAPEGHPPLPDELVAVTLKALAKKPDDRFPDMEAFCVALKELGGYARLSLTGNLPAVMPKVTAPAVDPDGRPSISANLGSSGVRDVAAAARRPPATPAIHATARRVPVAPPVTSSAPQRAPAAPPILASQRAPVAPRPPAPGAPVSVAGLVPHGGASPAPLVPLDAAADDPADRYTDLRQDPRARESSGGWQWDLATRSRRILASVAVIVVVSSLATLLAWITSGAGTNDSIETRAPADSAPAPPPPVAAPPPAPPAAAAEAPEAIAPRLMLSLRTVPSGAIARIGDREYGPTPVDVELEGAMAQPGSTLELTFQRRGYRATRIERTVHGPALAIDVALARAPGPAPRAASSEVPAASEAAAP